MVTVIIPALNESNTIGNVVQFCYENPQVSEVIVVDDNSEDNTSQIAVEKGARVIVSKTRGKGTSMKDGVQHATNNLLVFLDADIDPYPQDAIALLIDPLLKDEVDFVKGTFSRNAGRVTELVAKPLLHIFYPGLSHYTQPLSGMIAGRKNFFRKVEFFNDYGVDIGILIDMYLMKARIREVNIGYIENKSKPWESLGKMSKEVSLAIVSKAQAQQNAGSIEEEIFSLEAINREMNNTLREKLSGFRKMVVFDMDDTILKGRFIDECAKAFRFEPKLNDLRFVEKDPIILTKRIGLFLKGKTMDDLLNIAGSIEMVSDIKEVVKELKERDYLIGIISNSYSLITNYVKQNIGADFSLANQLEFFEGKVTGEVNLPSYFFAPPDCYCGHAFCKTNGLQFACEKYNVQLKNCIAVGDSIDDRCMIAHAGKGIAFGTSDALLSKIAFKSIKEKTFEPLLAIA